MALVALILSTATCPFFYALLRKFLINMNLFDDLVVESGVKWSNT